MEVTPLIVSRPTDVLKCPENSIICYDGVFPKYVPPCRSVIVGKSHNLLGLRYLVVKEAIRILNPHDVVYFQDTDDSTDYACLDKHVPFLYGRDLCISPTRKRNGQTCKLYCNPVYDLLGRRVHTSSLFWRLSWLYHVVSQIEYDGMFEYWLLFLSIVLSGRISYSPHVTNMWNGHGSYTKIQRRNVELSKKELKRRLQVLNTTEITHNFLEQYW